jgi:hypothetical protein
MDAAVAFGTMGCRSCNAVRQEQRHLGFHECICRAGSYQGKIRIKSFRKGGRSYATATQGAQAWVPKATYNFVEPTRAGASHVIINGTKDLVIDGQGSTLNFASLLSGGVGIKSSQRLAFKRFSLDWPRTLMASIGIIVSITQKANTLRIRIAPQYRVESSTQIIVLTPWDAKSDAAVPLEAVSTGREASWAVRFCAPGISSSVTA